MGKKRREKDIEKERRERGREEEEERKRKRERGRESTTAAEACAAELIDVRTESSVFVSAAHPLDCEGRRDGGGEVLCAEDTEIAHVKKGCQSCGRDMKERKRNK
jgi:hypothetical protein